MKKQTKRLLFQMDEFLTRLRIKFFPPSFEGLELSTEEANKVSRIVDSYYEERIRSEPVLMPQNTMLFGGGPHKKKLHFFNAAHYRADIRKAYAWAAAQGINVFVVDYTTPVGLLALETLLDLRHAGEGFRLYALQGAPISYRRSYRLIRETNIELIFLTRECDYHFSQCDLTILEIFDKISSKAGYFYNEDGIRINETNLEGWDEEQSKVEVISPHDSSAL